MFIFAYVKGEVNCKGVAEREGVIRFIGFAGGRGGGVRSSLDTFVRVADPAPMASYVWARSRENYRVRSIHWI